MAGVGDHNRSLKEALVESLTSVLSHQHEVRASGEEQVKALEVTEGSYIINLVLNPMDDVAHQFSE